MAKPFKYDIVFITLAVHGGAFHKIIYTSEILNEKGFQSKAIFSCESPLGLQEGIDFEKNNTHSLCKGRVQFLNHAEIFYFVQQTKAKLYVFDHSKTPLIGRLINEVKKDDGVETAQIGILFDDIHYWGSDYLFLPHPLTLWFTLEQRQSPSSKKIIEAKDIFFIGNILAEPVCNVWTSLVRDRSSLFKKYNLNPDLPTCLFMPNRVDGKHSHYGFIIDSITNTSINLLIKLHPWEYKNIYHEMDDYFGKKKTSADKWGVVAIEEKDASWATSFCDFVVLSGSSVGTEIPLWQKPVIFYSKKTWRTDIINDASIRVNSKQFLNKVLTNREWRHFTKEHFERAYQSIHPINIAPNGPIETFIEKVEKIISISSKKTIGFQDEKALKSLYKPYLHQTKGWSGSPIRSLRNKIIRIKSRIIERFIQYKHN